MPARLNGKVALITGGARGMGAATAQLFAAEGAKIVIGDILEDEGKILAKELGDAATFVALDVTQPDQWHAAISHATSTFGHLSILVNNAGIARFSPLADMTLEDYRLVTEVNQTAVFVGMKAAYPALRAAGGGSIINISSVDGMFGTPALSAYAASKFAVRGLTKVAAIEWAQDGIRVNSVHPGGISTPMVDSIPGISRAAFLDLVGRSVPAGRAGQPPEVAAMSLFLASDESSYCTGAEFVVDGGATCSTMAGIIEAAEV